MRNKIIVQDGANCSPMVPVQFLDVIAASYGCSFSVGWVDSAAL
jgi:hypothetical protein